MIPRHLQHDLNKALSSMPVVALLGPRQVGKTTLALELTKTKVDKPVSYLDLELDTDLAKLNDPESYLRRFENQLLIIDEVQLKPNLFRILRGLVDIRRRANEKNSQFLLLGSASRDRLQQSSETLAGRIRFLELAPLSIQEVQAPDPLGFNPEKLWFRGGFPDSYLAQDDDASWEWRGAFISSYVERDIPQMGLQIPATKMRRFWTMLAHIHGQQANLSNLGKSLEVSHTTIRNYLDILTDLYMVRQIPPWAGNTKKRLVKSPKIYLRDSGLLHHMLKISDYETLLGHPCLGVSWEGFVIENIITLLSDKWQYSYYRTTAQAEIDLVLESPKQEVWAIEIKRSTTPKLRKGFYLASTDIGATKNFVVYGGKERYPMKQNTEAIGVIEFLQMLS